MHRNMDRVRKYIQWDNKNIYRIRTVHIYMYSKIIVKEMNNKTTNPKTPIKTPNITNKPPP